MHKNCPVCKRALQRDTTHIDGYLTRYEADCLYCGRFEFDVSAVDDLGAELESNPLARSYLSHRAITRCLSNPADLFYLGNEVVEEIRKGFKLPNAREQADNLIRWAGANIQSPEGVVFPTVGLIAAIIGANSTSESIDYVLNHLEKEGLIEWSPLSRGGGWFNTISQISLTYKGWDRYAEIGRATQESTAAFMAMKFNDPELDHMFSNCFKPAIAATGFTLKLLSDDQRAGLIDNELVVRIRASKFLVADLTHANPGAYWEAGFAAGLGKPVIYTCKKEVFLDKEKGTHFDTNHHVTILWDPPNLAAATSELKAIVRATLPLEAKLSDS